MFRINTIGQVRMSLVRLEDAEKFAHLDVQLGFDPRLLAVCDGTRDDGPNEQVQTLVAGHGRAQDARGSDLLSPRDIPTDVAVGNLEQNEDSFHGPGQEPAAEAEGEFPGGCIPKTHQRRHHFE